MRSMRPLSTIVLVGIWLGGFSACTSVLLNTPVSKTAEGWVVTLGQVKEGPDEYVGEGSGLSAGPNEKLIWALLTVRNDAAQEQEFSYASCVLDAKEQALRPAIVDRHAEVASAADRVEAFLTGQERTRQLIYTYPKDERPTRMMCGKIVLPFPKPR
jgi:hypothetical protein